jgi:hypothetical protein
MLSNHLKSPLLSQAKEVKEDKVKIFESCQQELLQFVTKCVSIQGLGGSGQPGSRVPAGGMTGILDESVSEIRV